MGAGATRPLPRRLVLYPGPGASPFAAPRPPHAIPIRPRMGPGASSQATRSPRTGYIEVASAIEQAVIAKPMLFWIASAPPTIPGGQACADMLENWGESATTATPQAS